jgi:hypothetical protein
MLATIIIGVGTIGILALFAAGTRANITASELTTGLNLARNVKELSLSMAFTDPTSPTVFGLDTGESAATPGTYDDINDLNDRTFSPPLDSRRQQQPQFSDWSQKVVVQTVDPDRLTTAVPNGSNRKANRLTVTIYHHGVQICDLSWCVFDGTP